MSCLTLRDVCCGPCASPRAKPHPSRHPEPRRFPRAAAAYDSSRRGDLSEVDDGGGVLEVDDGGLTKASDAESTDHLPRPASFVKKAQK